MFGDSLIVNHRQYLVYFICKTVRDEKKHICPNSFGCAAQNAGYSSDLTRTFQNLFECV